jgi:hypothetical protein
MKASRVIICREISSALKEKEPPCWNGFLQWHEWWFLILYNLDVVLSSYYIRYFRYIVHSNKWCPAILHGEQVRVALGWQRRPPWSPLGLEVVDSGMSLLSFDKFGGHGRVVTWVFSHVYWWICFLLGGDFSNDFQSLPFLSRLCIFRTRQTQTSYFVTFFVY